MGAGRRGAMPPAGHGPRLIVRALAVIPAWVTHGVENTGDVTLKVVGFFGAATLAHLFAEPLIPGDGALTILHTVNGEVAYLAKALQPAGVA